MNTSINFTLIVELEKINCALNSGLFTVRGWHHGCLIKVTGVDSFRIINTKDFSTTISVLSNSHPKLTVYRRGDDYIKISRGKENIEILSGEREKYVTNLQGGDTISITDQDEEYEDTDDGSYESDFIDDDPIDTSDDDSIQRQNWD